MWHLARKTTQTIIFLVILITPAMAFFDVVEHSRSIYGDSLASRRIAGMGAFYQQIVEIQEHLLGDRSRNSPPLTQRFAGTPWALRIGGYVAIDPLNALGAMVADGGEVIMVLIAALPLALLTIILGRVFCGWLCPVHFLLEMTDSLREGLIGLGVPVRNIRLKRRMKYVVLGLGSLITAIIGVQIFSLIYPPAVLGRQLFEWIYFGSMGSGAIFLVAIAVGEIFLSRRVWCRYLCPGGGLYSLLGSFRIVSIRRASSLCDSCGDCNRICAFGLSPMTDLTGMECTSCLECVRACPTDALVLKLTSPSDFRALPMVASAHSGEKVT